MFTGLLYIYYMGNVLYLDSTLDDIKSIL